MNLEETKRAIEVMQAYVDGETVEACVRGTSLWIRMSPNIDWAWNWHQNEYRIKPKPREWLINLDTKMVGIEVKGPQNVPLHVIRVREVQTDE